MRWCGFEGEETIFTSILGLSGKMRVSKVEIETSLGRKILN